MRRWLLWLAGLIAVVIASVMLASQVSPWPSALVYRRLMDDGGVKMHRALEKHVPGGVTSRRNLRYDSEDPDATYDLFHPTSIEGSAQTLPTILWIHGGGFISGSKDQIANYLRIIAAKGFTTIGINYSLAPGAKYPTPVRQANAALAFVLRGAASHHINGARIFFAGDSAGAQIAAQLALLVSSGEHAAAVGIQPAITRRQLAGAVLFCGVHDPRSLSAEGSFGGFVRTTGWAYFGTRDFQRDPRAQQASIVRGITREFPPIFISAGNADPLGPQSRLLAEAATMRGVPVDSLFFADDYRPPLGHEYQFNLDTDAGREALDRMIAFLKKHSG
jgi:acetyl esterase